MGDKLIHLGHIGCRLSVDWLLIGWLNQISQLASDLLLSGIENKRTSITVFLMYIAQGFSPKPSTRFIFHLVFHLK